MSKKPLRKRVPLPVRFFLQLICLVLCLVLMVGTLAAVLVMDLRSLKSGDGIKQLITAAMSISDDSQTTPDPAPQTLHGGYAVSLGETDIPIPELPGDTELPPDLSLPEDITDIDSLASWIADLSKEMFGQEAQINEETVKSFLEDSTVTDYLAEKISDLADDVLNGTTDTVITVEELVGLVEENREAVKEHFGIEITDEHMQQVEQTATKLVEEDKINDAIHQAVQEVVSSENTFGGVSVQQMLTLVNQVTSDQTFYLVLAVCALLVLLMVACNFYNLPNALTWAGVSCTVTGAILSVPMILLQAKPDILQSLFAELGSVMPAIQSALGVFKPYHYGLLGVGIGCIVVSIVLRILRSSLYHIRHPLSQEA